MIDLKFMIVEDELHLLNSLTKILKREVREVFPFSNPLDAINEYDTIMPDVIMTDIKMPDIDGIEMISRIRAKSEEIPIIVASAFTEPEYFQKAIGLKIEKFTIKPIIIDELIEVLLHIEKQIKIKKELQFHSKVLEEYKEIVDSNNPVSKTDLKGAIIYVNDEFVKMTGYSRDELLGKSHKIIRHPDVSNVLYENMWKILITKKSWKGIIKNKKRDGSTIYAKTTITPMIDINDNVIEYISISNDITQMVLSLENERKLNDLKDDFLRNISHEVKTPLNIIGGTLSLIQKRNQDSKIKLMIDQIDDATQRLLTTMYSIVDLSQITTNTYEFNIQLSTIYNDLIRAIESHFEQSAKKNIDIKYQIDEMFKEPLMCDFKLIQHVLNALIDNAIKFNNSGGKVAIKINRFDGNGMKIQVKDNGVGIESSKKEEIFKPFYQLDGSMTRKHEGIGVGLALTKLIVDMLEGGIEVESSPGKGALFSVILNFNKSVNIE